MSLVLKKLERVEDDEVTYVQVRCCRIEAKLDAQPVALFKPMAQVVRNVDLDRPLTQSVEEVAAQLTSPLLK